MVAVSLKSWLAFLLLGPGLFLLNLAWLGIHGAGCWGHLDDGVLDNALEGEGCRLFRGVLGPLQSV